MLASGAMEGRGLGAGDAVSGLVLVIGETEFALGLEGNRWSQLPLPNDDACGFWQQEWHQPRTSHRLGCELGMGMTLRGDACDEPGWARRPQPQSHPSPTVDS